MAELGQTSDPKELVPGDAERVHETSWSLRAHGDVLCQAGEGLRRIDTTDGWSGRAADAFRDAFDGEPGRWVAAGDAFHEASRALDTYVSSLTWAQGQAAEAIRLWNEGQAATSKAESEHVQAVAKAQHEGDATASVPFTDPGEAKREAARQILDRARSQLTSASDTAAEAVGRARDQAPEKPGFWSKVASGIGDVTSGVLDTLGDAGAHMVNDVASLGNAALHHPGDVAAAAGGGLLTVASGAGDGLGFTLDATGVGAVAGVPLNTVSTAGVVAGVGITGTAMANIAQHAAGDDHAEPLTTNEGTGSSGSGMGETPAGAKSGWESRPADNGRGTVYQRPGADGDADSIRIADPTPQYPHGYVRFYNEHGQPVDLNGKPTSRAETHIPRAPDGSYPLPKGW